MEKRESGEGRKGKKGNTQWSDSAATESGIIGIFLCICAKLKQIHSLN